MIFYFSGTGNSLQVAENIAEHQGEELVSIAALMNHKKEFYEFRLKENEIVGFVYPVYAWAPPDIVLRFIKRLKLLNNNNNYIFSIATCGDNIGRTMAVLERTLKKAGLKLDSGFSVQMPNNYVVMFDVDSKELEDQKLSAAQNALSEINKVIKDRETGVFRLVTGFIPSIMTVVMNPLFNKMAISTRRFYADEQCTGCGICEKVCNCKSIRLVENKGNSQLKPVWGKECAQCFACLHYCPVRAIQFGKGTVKKGRYTNPKVSVKEMFIKDIAALRSQ